MLPFLKAASNLMLLCCSCLFSGASSFGKGEAGWGGAGGAGDAGHSKLIKSLSFDGKRAAAGAERLPRRSRQHGSVCFAVEVVSHFDDSTLSQTWTPLTKEC